MKRKNSRKTNRKRRLGTLTTIVWGMFLLTGCGNGPVSPLESLSPDQVRADMENQGDQGQEVQGSSQGQNGQGVPGQDGQAGQVQGGRTRLTLGVLGYTGVSGMQHLLEAYNAQSKEYYVELVEYQPEHADLEASTDRFCMDLATGKGTDLVLFGGGMVPDELGHAGVILDLNAFLTAEEKQEKYLGNILECAQTGNALYEISPAFTLGFIVGDGGRIGMDSRWTLEEMQESFARWGRDGLALAKGQGRTVERLVEASIEDYVDWDAGTADFCKEEFYRILEFGKATDNREWICPTRESVASGTHLASCEGIVNVADMQYFRWLFGDNAVVKGFPCSHGTGVAVSIQQDSMGICSYSQYPEGAWDFLEYYVGAAWTEWEFSIEGDLIQKNFSNYFGGLPVNRQMFEKMLEESMVQQYYDNGEPCPVLQGEGEVPDFYANTAQDVEMLREVVALADRRYLPDQSVICQIIGEEISGYNADILTAQQTAERIQNRVQLYLDEWK